mmetsp:Transcript_27772/g.69316  ORF Transcript_27772/g.69316 Transcript_27772/m.69316 type:complete len:235 (-) Transcript_27772:8576-9280(-)
MGVDAAAHTVSPLPGGRAHALGDGGGAAVHPALASIETDVHHTRLGAIRLLDCHEADASDCLAGHWDELGPGKDRVAAIGLHVALREGQAGLSIAGVSVGASGGGGGAHEDGVLQPGVLDLGVVHKVERDADVRVRHRHAVQLHVGTGVHHQHAEVRGFPDGPLVECLALVAGGAAGATSPHLGPHVHADHRTHHLVATHRLLAAIVCDDHEASVLRAGGHVARHPRLLCGQVE